MINYRLFFYCAKKAAIYSTYTLTLDVGCVNPEKWITMKTKELMKREK